MFMSAVMRPWVGKAVDQTNTNVQDQSCNVLTDPNCLVSARINYALRGKGNEGLDWGASFGTKDAKKVGQNLYIAIYKKAQAKPLDDATQATAAAYGLPPERMKLILAGDITPILEKSPLMSIEKATDIYNQMITTFNDKKDSAMLDATIKSTVEPNEMFADGDLGNSGFDLINDLNNIEIILFKQNDEVTFGKPYSGSGGDNAAAGGGGGGGGAAGQPPAAINIPIDVNGGSGKAGGGGQQGGVAAKTNMQNPFQLADVNKTPILGAGINPNQCFSAQNVDKAINDFVAAGVKDSRLKSSFDPAQLPTNNQVAAVPGGAGGGGGAVVEPVPAVVIPGGGIEIPFAAPADYSAPSLCGEVICLTVDFIMKKAAVAFGKKDNCIACHVEYINDSLQKTISHSLIPGKATGNMGESGLCKKAMGTSIGSISMNISVNLVPIITPPKNDLMTVGNIADEWDKYASKYGAWNYDTKHSLAKDAKSSGKPVDNTPLPTADQRALEVVVMNSGDGATIAEVMAKTADSLNAQQAQQTKDQLVFDVAQNASGDVDTMKALDDQMQQMNQFFDGFRKQIMTLSEKVPGLSSSLACSKLEDKSVCT